MQKQEALAAVLRGLRAARGLNQNELPEITARYVSKLEQGEANPTLDVLTGVAAALQVTPAALLLLLSATESGDSVQAHLKSLEAEILELGKAGVIGKVSESVASPPPSRGRPSSLSPEIREEIKRLSDAGLGHSEIAEKLGMSRSTVQRQLAGK